MYIIQNKTENTSIICEGHFPSQMLEDLLNKGNKLIVISLYSNTLKVPYSVEENGEIHWEFEDFNLINEMFRPSIQPKNK